MNRDETGHYALLERDEPQAAADCGCRLERWPDGAVALRLCPLHAAAPELRDALAALCAFEGALYGGAARDEGLCIEATLTAGRAAVRKAKGEKT